jgi:hypothetical protein
MIHQQSINSTVYNSSYWQRRQIINENLRELCVCEYVHVRVHRFIIPALKEKNKKNFGYKPFWLKFMCWSRHSTRYKYWSSNVCLLLEAYFLTG